MIDVFADHTLVMNAVIIAAFAAIQSIFGMGILVFGTPTFLILGYDFTDTLGILLPSSLSISIAQVIFHRGPRPQVSKGLLFICLPMVGIALFTTISTSAFQYADLIVAGALLLSAMTRLVPGATVFLRGFLTRNLKLYHAVMGFFHGATNMGGAFLAVMASTIYKTKDDARYIVAIYYMSFVLIQCTILLSSFGSKIFATGMLFVPTSLVVYTVFGNKLFKRLNNDAFQMGMTGFLLLYAGVLILR